MMTLEELANREKDISRALYIQMIAGKNDGYEFKLIKELRSILFDIEKVLSFNHLGINSDLAGLARWEQDL